MKVRKKDSTILLNSLYGGVVPSRGLEHIMVGRTNEANQILSELSQVKSGVSKIKFLVGDFGNGKSFMISLIQQIAFKENFVVSKADFTPERRLYANDGKALALYKEVMKNLRIASMDTDESLMHLLDQWAYTANDNAALFDKVILKIRRLVGGYDFAKVIVEFTKAHSESDEFKKEACIRWLRGEFRTKNEAKRDLSVSEIINDANAFEYLKIFALFFRAIGYSGFVVNFDETINLYKITHPASREKNYEVILKIYNEIMQGVAEGLFVTFAGTPDSVFDEGKGIFSYAALRTRLSKNDELLTGGFKDYNHPIMELQVLGNEEIFVLLQKIRTIHEIHYGYKSEVSDIHIELLVKKLFSDLGAREHITPRDATKTFIGIMNVLEQNKNLKVDKLISDTLANSVDDHQENAANRFMLSGEEE